jgi:predicted metalloendopeptidase
MNSQSALPITALLAICSATFGVAAAGADSDDAPIPVPRFSVDYMDRSVAPDTDFYRFACGTWLKKNPVPEDKPSWASFMEVRERNTQLLHGILEEASKSKTEGSPITRKLGDFYLSALNTSKLDELKFAPLQDDFRLVAALKSPSEAIELMARFMMAGKGGNVFAASVDPDDHNSIRYILQLEQGGLSLPDRDYYLTDQFAKERTAYVAHVAKMFRMSGDSEEQSSQHAGRIMDLETALAKASKSRIALRDPIENYHKFSLEDAAHRYPSLNLPAFIAATGLTNIKDLVIRQPEFFDALETIVKERPISDWQAYLRWHLLRAAAPHLHAEADAESFAFFGTVLNGQPVQEPRWKRAIQIIDRDMGEALGKLYVDKYFPPEASRRMNALVGNIKEVFRGRLQKLDWMTDATKAKALTKFDRFTQKIGYPAKFRDYSSIEIKPDDLVGNIRRATAFEMHRRFARIDDPVDRTEWDMTPPTVNAYFNPPLNEIVFPAGILQPPFFDASLDDAVNYGGIGAVIGHEITHGYDDQGRKFDADGNLNEWWTEKDAEEFMDRTRKLADQYSHYEALPGLFVKGRLTLGENIADLGGVTIAYEALERALAADPSKRKTIDGFTPEQRFFLAFAQIWRVNWRDAALRRSITTNPHSPGAFRAVGPLVNVDEFFTAFNIKEGSPMWRPPAERTKIW